MSPASLPVVAAWDAAGVRRAVAALDGVAEWLPGWRFRLEAVCRSLETAECWSGPAASTASAAVLDLSGVVTAIGRGLVLSLAAFEQLDAEVAQAADLAAEALALGVDPGGGSATTGMPPADGAADRAVAALRHASLAAAAASAAGESLRGLGVTDAFVPAGFGDLLARVAPEMDRLPGIPAGTGPEGIARWWAALSEGARERLIAASPDQLGRLDGVPAWARDRANRLVLDRVRAASDGGGGTAAAVAAELADASAVGRPVQLFSFDPVAGVAAVAFGDMDTAAALALLVPGILTTAADDLPGLDRDAEAVADAARDAAPGLAVATVAWLGYHTPEQPWEILTRRDAQRGGRALDDTLDGLAAARTATREAQPRTTVLAHSYGTVVVDEAAHRPGPLATDAVVLLGSPGMSPGGAAGLEVPEVYDAAAAADPVSWSAWFGTDTWAAAYGATELPTDPHTLHTQYYDPDRPTLAAMGQVVAGRRAGR